jgi:hypothetical protein
MSAAIPELGVCRTCRKSIFRHSAGAWLHEYRAAGNNHPAEPRVDLKVPSAPEGWRNASVARR